MRRLQLEEERVLGEVEQDGKENVRGRGRVGRVFGEVKRVENNGEFNNQSHSRSSSKNNPLQNSSNPSQQSNRQLSQPRHQSCTTPQYLHNLHCLITQLDTKSTVFPALLNDNKLYVQPLSEERMFEDIRQFIEKRQGQMEKVHGELSEMLGRVRGNVAEEIKEKKQNASRVINQQGTKLFGRIHALHQQQLINTKIINTNPYLDNHPSKPHQPKQHTFTQLLTKLTEHLQQTTLLKQRNSEFAKTIMNLSREVQMEKDQKVALERKIKAKDERSGEMVDMMKRENGIVREKVRVLEGEVRELREERERQLGERDKVIEERERVIEERDKVIEQKERQLQQKQQQCHYSKSISLQLNQQLLELNKQLLCLKEQYHEKCLTQTKSQHYFRQNLTLQQQITILSQQNQKLISELNEARLVNQHQQNGIKQQHSMKEQEQNIMESTKGNLQRGLAKVQSTAQNSLIYRELEKRNRKLIDENRKLIEENGGLTGQLQTMKHQIQEMSQQISNLTTKLGQTNNQLQSTKMELQQQQTKHNPQSTPPSDTSPTNLTLKLTQIQEQFQLLVRQKLQLQKQLLSTKSQNKRITQSYEQFIEDMVGRVGEIGELLSGIKEDKEYLWREVERLRLVVGEGLREVKDGLVAVVRGYVERMKGLEGGRVQTQQQQQQQQLIAHTAPTIQSNYPQQHQHLLTQHNLLLTEFNHLIFQLNSFKQLYTQLEIQKELCQKYYEEDLMRLKGCVVGLERENQRLRGRGTGGAGWGYGQQTDCSLKRITSNLVNIVILPHSTKYQGKSQSVQTDHNKPIPNLALNHCVSSINHPAQTLINNRCNLHSCVYNIDHSPLQTPLSCKQPHLPAQPVKLKINSDLFSIQIQCQHQPTPKSSCHKQQDDSQHEMTFQEWIQKISVQEQDNLNQNFKLFCISELAQTKQYQQVNNRREMFEKLNRQECINSPGSKALVGVQNKEQQHSSTRLNLMGSLYNRFTFPKLAQQPNNKDKGIQTTTPPPQPQPKYPNQSYPPLQAITIKPLPNPQRKLPKERLKTQPVTASQSRLQPQIQMQDDESFDLCII